jgi:hypothetical protein
MMPPTLATRLGTTTHVSALLRKAALLGLRTPDDLSALAVQRGCRHYWHEGVPEGELATREQFSDAELAIALLNVALPFDSHAIRCGAAMVSAEGNSPKNLAWLAKLERSERVLRYVAECGEKFEPENSFWTELLDLLPVTPPEKDGALPHPTRFVSMTGYVRGVGPKIVTQWERPQRKKIAA